MMLVVSGLAPISTTMNMTITIASGTVRAATSLDRGSNVTPPPGVRTARPRGARTSPPDFRTESTTDCGWPTRAASSGRLHRAADELAELDGGGAVGGVRHRRVVGGGLRSCGRHGRRRRRRPRGHRPRRRRTQGGGAGLDEGGQLAPADAVADRQPRRVEVGRGRRRRDVLQRDPRRGRAVRVRRVGLPGRGVQRGPERLARACGPAPRTTAPRDGRCPWSASGSRCRRP